MHRHWGENQICRRLASVCQHQGSLGGRFSLRRASRPRGESRLRARVSSSRVRCKNKRKQTCLKAIGPRIVSARTVKSRVRLPCDFYFAFRCAASAPLLIAVSSVRVRLWNKRKRTRRPLPGRPLLLRRAGDRAWNDPPGNYRFAASRPSGYCYVKFTSRRYNEPLNCTVDKSAGQTIVPCFDTFA